MVTDEDAPCAVFDVAFGHIGDLGFDGVSDVFGEDFVKPTWGVVGLCVGFFLDNAHRDG